MRPALAASSVLRDLEVLVIDCQATGATPAHGDLLELGWAVCGEKGLSAPPRAHWITPRSDRGVSNAVRKLTGWDDDCLAVSVDPAEAWSLLREDAATAHAPAGPVRTVIHFARFELPFLRELHGGAQPFPLDTICVHAIAQRLFPDLPRRNLRALAGHLGHAPEMRRRSAGHVEATAFIWRALVARLDAAGVRTWDDLKGWLEGPAPSSRARRAKRAYPLAPDRRRALPDAPGVYRFLRPNGDVLYVGKAASLKKRVASHFAAGARATERALEMLSQVHDIEVTLAGTVLEAALLETDEIKRIDPPYNVQLRTGERRAWFASTDWQSASYEPDAQHAIGPLPSRDAVAAIGTMRGLLDRRAGGDGAGEVAPSDAAVRAIALSVGVAFAPDEAMFRAAWGEVVRLHLGDPRDGSAAMRLLRASQRIVIDDAPPDEDDGDAAGWDPERVRRSLERAIVREGQLVRRAGLLTLLAHADVAFREPRAPCARVLVLERGVIIERHEGRLAATESLANVAIRRPPSRRVRQASFDAATYDRMRVLATELRRIAEQGGSAVVRVGAHVLPVAGRDQRSGVAAAAAGSGDSTRNAAGGSPVRTSGAAGSSTRCPVNAWESRSPTRGERA